jgi:hypothetical protein
MNVDNLDQLLRDGAEPARPGRVPSQLLDTILATPSDEVTEVRRAPRRRTVWALAGLATAALVTTAVIVVPQAGGDTAFASWTPTAEPMSAEALRSLVPACVEVTMPAGAAAASDPPYNPHPPVQYALGEVRGTWEYVFVVTDEWSASCLRTPSGDVYQGGGSFDRGEDRPDLGRSGITLDAAAQEEANGGIARLTAGRVGTDVTGIDIITPSGKTVSATVSGGCFLAWFPDKEGEKRPTRYVLHLKDGSERRLTQTGIFPKLQPSAG